VSALASKADEIARNENGSYVPGADQSATIQTAKFSGDPE
jgi:hypothetical protein